MKRLAFILLLLFVSFQLSAQYQQDSAWIRDNYNKKEFMIPMRDGVKLFTSVYIPKDTSQTYPILIRRTPYSCAPYGEDQYEAFWTNYLKYYLREGYIMVKQDVRGKWMSEGEFVDVRPFNPDKQGNEIDEASDTFDTIEWLLQNLNNHNGNVGVFGISYPGFYSTMAALSGHPALKAVSPQAPVTDWFLGDDFHHNGAFFQMDAFVFYSSFGKPRPKPSTQRVPGYQIPLQDNYEFFLRAGTFKNLAKLLGEDVAFWKDLAAHPNYDEFWQKRNVRNFVQHIPESVATMVVGGLFDAEDLFGGWATYKAIEEKAKNNNRLIMGPWYHGQWARDEGEKLGNVKFGQKTSLWYQNEIELKFFNYYLKGKGNIDHIKEAVVFFTGENQWKTFDVWPPKETAMQPYYLQANGKLSTQKPTEKQSFSQYTSHPDKPVPYTEDVHLTRTIPYLTDDQRFAARRPDVLVFGTDVLEEDLTLAGPVIANLLTSISTTDADFVVKLIDVFPDDFTYDGERPQGGRFGGGPYPMGGYQMLVRGEIMRGKYRNSFSRPVPFKPNKVETVRFELPDVSHTFKKGHRIMIQIQSSWFPLADRNPQQFMNIYEAEEKDYIPSVIKIHHDTSNASYVELPVMKKQDY